MITLYTAVVFWACRNFENHHRSPMTVPKISAYLKRPQCTFCCVYMKLLKHFLSLPTFTTQFTPIFTVLIVDQEWCSCHCSTSTRSPGTFDNFSRRNVLSCRFELNWMPATMQCRKHRFNLNLSPLLASLLKMKCNCITIEQNIMGNVL